MKNIITEKIYIGDIPLLSLTEKNSDKAKGVIFIYHGWSSKKENYHFIASIFAINGYQVIIPDSVNHGERGTLEYEIESVMEENFWNTVINSVDEYFKVKKSLTEQKKLLSDKMFVMGNSMGGMISSGIFVKDSSLLGLVVMNGACNWPDLDERIKKSRNINRSRGVSQELLNKYNPAAYIEKFAQRPLLIQHGEEDEFVPIKTQESFYKQLREHYKAKEENLRFTKTPNLNHHKTTGMIEESYYWFNEICALSK